MLLEISHKNTSIKQYFASGKVRNKKKSDVHDRDEFLKVAPGLYAAVGVRKYCENVYKPIPIIPKAALEACCFIKSGMLADYVEPHLCQVFKNFIWSHERHTESTKARFKKVMEIWLT